MKIKKFFVLILVFVVSISCGLLPPAPVAPPPASPTMSATLPAPAIVPVPVLPTPTPGVFAHIPELQGGVQAKRPADVDFLAAFVGMTLQSLSQVRTLDDGRARLDLSTGTIIRITPNSLFTLTVQNPDPVDLLVRLKLTVGQLFIILKGGSVEVETPSGVASVRGSFMSVVIDPKTGDALVQCLEGSCQLKTRAGSFDLSTGRKARLQFSPEGAAPLAPVFDVLTESDIQNWLLNSPEANSVRDVVKATVESILPPGRVVSTIESQGTILPVEPISTRLPNRTPIKPKPPEQSTKPSGRPTKPPEPSTKPPEPPSLSTPLR